MRIGIVGGVAGGASAAARMRRLDEKAEIILFERNAHISYANCGLPYYIGDEIRDREHILLHTPESFSARFNVDVRVFSEVTGIDRARKEVTVRETETGREYRERYDKLILAPGAEPLEPPIIGIENPRIFTLRTVPDADAIKEFIAKHHPQRAVVVGGGYIGLEMAENLHARGIFVTLVEMARQVIAPLDFEMASEVHQHLKTKNVEFYLNEQVIAFVQEANGLQVRLKSGLELAADFVILSIGIKPEIKLAKEAGLAIGETGGILVNEYLQTSDPSIYAVGDAVETFDPILNLKRLVPLAGPANKQARIAADNVIGGNTETYRGTVATAIAKVFDLTVGVTGYAEKFLRQHKVDYQAVIVHGVSHAGYYPGSTPLSIKISFSPRDGRLYGAQVVGYSGVDKVTEVFSLACQFGLTVQQLKEMDQAYAPPYSSAKSTVNMAGFVADNIRAGKLKVVSWQDIQDMDDGVFLLDVRTHEEAQLGQIGKSHLIPLTELRQRLNEIPRDKKIYTYCAVGLRGYLAARILMQHGFAQVYNLSGGYKTWENAVMKQSNEDIFDKYRIEKDDMLYLKERRKDVERGKPVPAYTSEIDTRGLQCPGPIMKLNEKIAALRDGDSVRVLASDPGFVPDVQSWCNVTGNRLLSLQQHANEVDAVVQKCAEKRGTPGVPQGNDKTIVVFSDDFDRALAALVIANGALSMGRKVTLFFTFWGLNILKKKNRPAVRKDLVSRMFGWMMPGHAGVLKLSKLNMLGMGPWMMKGIMRRKKINTLEELLQKAAAGGAVMVACQMSMDVMGIRREELIDEARIGGVATYLEASETASLNLFI